MISLITVSFVLALTAALVAFWPLLELKFTSQPSSLLREFERLTFEKDRYLNNLKDLELDRLMKKITEEDYQELRNQILAEAEGIYAALEKLEKENEIFQQIDRDLRGVEKELLNQ